MAKAAKNGEKIVAAYQKHMSEQVKSEDKKQENKKLNISGLQITEEQLKSLETGFAQLAEKVKDYQKKIDKAKLEAQANTK